MQRGHEQVPAPGEAALRENKAPARYNEVHLNLASRLDESRLLAIGRREGWITRVCDRRFFRLVEMWIENRFLLELMSGEEFERYRTVHDIGELAQAIE